MEVKTWTCENCGRSEDAELAKDWRKLKRGKDTVHTCDDRCMIEWLADQQPRPTEAQPTPAEETIITQTGAMVVVSAVVDTDGPTTLIYTRGATYWEEPPAPSDAAHNAQPSTDEEAA